MTFGKRFRQWREKKGVSGWQIEKATTVSRSNITGIEMGRFFPSDSVMKELAAYKPLGLTYTRLRAWKALSLFSKKELALALDELK